MKIAVLGVGLIGGSIGLAARGRLDAEVAGFDPDAELLAKAEELGAISAGRGSVAEAVAGAEVVFCAAPVGALPELAAEALDAAGEDDRGHRRRLGQGARRSPRWARIPASSAATRWRAPRPRASRTPAPTCSRGRAGT